MTRQYIGARYVPKFAEPFQYDPNTAYEPLTIVGYNSNSYTSKKAVPAGIAPTNGEYWVMTANYSQQVEEYREEVEAVKEELDEIKARNLDGKKVALIGDSNAVVWADSNPFSDYETVTFVSYAVGGTTLAASYTNNIEQQYNRMALDGMPDYVIIWCGGNDTQFHPNYGEPALGDFSRPSGLTTFESLRRMLVDIRSSHPQTKIVAFTRSDFPNWPGRNKQAGYIFSICERIYNEFNVPIVSFESIANISEYIAPSYTYYYENDFVHYNSRGAKLITDAIIGAMISGLNVYKERPIVDIYVPDSITNQNDAVAFASTQIFNGNIYTEATNSIVHWYESSVEKTVAITPYNSSKYMFNDGKHVFSLLDSRVQMLMSGSFVNTGIFNSYKDIPDGVTTMTEQAFKYISVGLPDGVKNNVQGGVFLIKESTSAGFSSGLLVCVWSSTPHVYAIADSPSAVTYKDIVTGDSYTASYS